MNGIHHLNPRALGSPGERHDDNVWVELTNPREGRAATIRLRRLPARLGYAADCDVALSGVASPAAITLDRSMDGVLTATPAAGCRVRFNQGPATTLSHAFDAWALIELGHQALRVVDAGGASANRDEATRRAPSRSAMFRAALWQGMRALPHALLLAAGFLMIGLADWLADFGETGYLAVLRLDAARVPNLLLWFGAWCLLSLWASGAFRWRAHLRITSWAVAVFGAAKVLVPLLLAYVGQPMPDLLRNIGWVLVALASGALHLAAIPLTPGRRRHGALLLALAATALCFSPVQQSLKVLDVSPPFPATLPVSLDRSTHEPQESALRRLSQLKKDVDDARLVPPPKQ